MKFTDITGSEVGKIITSECIAIEVRQTKGPVIITLDDGSMTFKSISFSKKIQAGQAIRARLKIVRRGKDIESHLEDFEIIEASPITRKIEKRLDEQSKTNDIEPLVKSDIFQSDAFEKTAIQIKRVALQNKQIVIRHHSDADGICGAYAIEYSLRDVNPNIQVKRTPSRTPYYDYTDMLRDSENSAIIICDMGSNEASELSIRKARLLGIKVIVIDHHDPGEFKTSEISDCHLNPFNEGLDLNINTGILCTELARKIVGDIPDHLMILPAIAGMGDRSKGEMFDSYVKIANDLGYESDLLKGIAESLDFELYHIRFPESKITGSLLSPDKNLQKEIVELLSSEIEKRKSKAIDSVMDHLQKEERNGAYIYSYDVDAYTKKEYPGSGKITGMIKDNLQGKPILVMGVSDQRLTLRMKDIPGFSIVNLVKRLRKRLPDLMVAGGGHDVAGGISFLKGGKERVISEVYRYVTDMMVPTLHEL